MGLDGKTFAWQYANSIIFIMEDKRRMVGVRPKDSPPGARGIPGQGHFPDEKPMITAEKLEQFVERSGLPLQLPGPAHQLLMASKEGRPRHRMGKAKQSGPDGRGKMTYTGEIGDESIPLEEDSSASVYYQSPRNA